MSNPPLRELCESLHIQFKDPKLLLTALTHRSFTHESRQKIEDNERLEFLGDALLGALVADVLMSEFPRMREGELTRMRAALVRSESLAALALGCNLGVHLRIGLGEEANGGRQRESILAGAFEALIGALYLDQGLEVVRDFLKPMLFPLFSAAQRVAEMKDARSRLQEWAQAKHGVTPQYKSITHSGPKHAAVFVVEVRIKENINAIGRGHNKQSAAQQAAHKLLEQVAPDLAIG